MLQKVEKVEVKSRKMMSEYILEMDNISKSFFGVQVLDEVYLHVKPGEVHVLLGENGAGKSTLIKILSGAYRKETGEIRLSGATLNVHNPKDAIDKGVSVIYQEFNLNPHGTVFDNIYCGKELKKFGFVDDAKAIENTKKYMDMIGLRADPKTLVSKLSVAQKQMVEICKAIASEVKVLVLDEPTAALTDQETENLFAIIRRLKTENIGIIYISHRLQEIFEIGDRCTVMRDGKTIKTFELAETDIDELIFNMVGRNVVFEKMENRNIDGGVKVLEVDNLSYRNIVKNASFYLKKGEILGVSGLVGSGRTELAKCIISRFTPDSGTIRVNGETVKSRGVGYMVNKGVVYLSEDRKDEALIVAHSVERNVELPNLKQFSRLFIDGKKAAREVKSYIDKLKVKTTGNAQQVERLSGGNQQKVVIAKWLLNDADIYIFDEPTRGIDVGSREEIYGIMYDLVAKGASIIMISSDLVEILKMSDRIMVMREGSFTANLENDGVTEETLLKYSITGEALQ